MLWSTRADLTAKIVAPNESPRESEVPRLLSRRRGLGHSCDGAPGFSCLDDRLATPYFSRKPSGKALDLAASVAVLQDTSRTNADAITGNAEALATFAENTQKYVEAFQAGAVALQRELALAKTSSVVSATAAVFAFALAAYALGT